MRHKLSDRVRPLWLAALVALTALTGLGLAAASAQDGIKPIVRAANAKTAVITSGSGAYYIEFRSRYAWDYGHTYLVHGKVGETPTKDSVAGLSPVGDDATAWVIGHYVPVPAETGWTDGDLEDKYVSARYRVLIYPKIFVNNLRKINTGHPEAADQLISDNVKEMSNPTRDGRAMINNGVYTIRADGTPTSATVAARPSPKVTIGPIRASNKTPGSVAASEPSP
jgi:hypothetical protein